MSVQYCMKCMNKQFVGVSVCPHCGTPYHQPLRSANALKPGHILNGKYLVGAVLGQGGFGITYIGLDLILEKKVAIKECFPVSTGMVSRHNSAAVTWNSEINPQSGLQLSIESFLKEARKMAKVDSIPCVVKVRDFFSQNNTAYIVMDYIEGETLAQKLQREGPMPLNQCLSMLTPIMHALAQVHQHGIIHRDISPDNIMVQPNGNLMLLDLGAAKEIDFQKRDGSIKSSQLVAKDGFSPMEQYTSNGHIGAWTDVYAMSATIYYCCTGKLPPTATVRISSDPLTRLPPLRPKEFEVLKKGMAIASKDRIQTMEDLLWQLQAVAGAKKSISLHKNDLIPSQFSAMVKKPTTVAAILLGTEALVLLYTAYTLEIMYSVILLRIAGCLLAVYGLLQANPSKILFSAGSIALCFSFWPTVSQISWIGGVSTFFVPVLLMSEQMGISKSQQWLPKYWFVPTAVYCAYLVMLCAQPFHAHSFIIECLTGCAITLVMREFAKQAVDRK